MSVNEYWVKEEFEDLVARSIIAMFETKLKKHKNSAKSTRLTPEILKSVRSLGCYFAAPDRLLVIQENEKGIASAVQEIDVLNDGRPKRAIMCHSIKNTGAEDDEDMRKDCYMEITYLENINGLPKGIQANHTGKVYRTTKIWMRNNCLEGISLHNIVDHTGKVYGTYRMRSDYNPVTGRCFMEKVSTANMQNEEERTRAEDITTVEVAATISTWQDRRYLWNVTANEGFAKATFGVYPEEVKSLFYAREMPMTETGRKRPMLHWVAAHNRRMKSGIDVDIEKHLRGINEFVYQGTKFTITRPLKEKQL